MTTTAVERRDSTNGTQWRNAAACLSVPTEVFYQESSYGLRQCREICGACPVRDDCLADCLATETPSAVYGFRAGLSARQRLRILNGADIAPRPDRTCATEGCTTKAAPQSRCCWACKKRQAVARRRDRTEGAA